MGYRGYGLPTSELISEGNIGLMQGVKKFEPDRASAWPLCDVVDPRLDPGIYPAPWSLVKMGTTAAQKKLFFNLRRMKSKLDAFEDGGTCAPRT